MAGQLSARCAVNVSKMCRCCAAAVHRACSVDICSFHNRALLKHWLGAWGLTRSETIFGAAAETIGVTATAAAVHMRVPWRDFRSTRTWLVYEGALFGLHMCAPATSATVVPNTHVCVPARGCCDASADTMHGWFIILDFSPQQHACTRSQSAAIQLLRFNPDARVLPPSPPHTLDALPGRRSRIYASP